MRASKLSSNISLETNLTKDFKSKFFFEHVCIINERLIDEEEIKPEKIDGTYNLISGIFAFKTKISQNIFGIPLAAQGSLRAIFDKR